MSGRSDELSAPGTQESPSAVEMPAGTESPIRHLDLIVVTYGSAAKVPECLDSIARATSVTRGSVGLIVVDNSPDSHDADFFESWGKGRSHAMTVIRRPDNPGFAASANLGAQASKARWIGMMNPDLVMTQDTCIALCELVGSCGPDIHAMAVAQRTNGREHQGIGINAAGWFFDRSRGSRTRIQGPSGGAGLYRRVTFLALGGFREELFAWGEDAEFAIRLSAAGYTTSCPNLILDHLGGHSIKHDPILQNRKAALLLSNRFEIARRHYSRGLRMKFAIYAGLVTLAKSVGHARSRRLVQMTRIFAKGCLRLFGQTPINESKKTQR